MATTNGGAALAARVQRLETALNLERHKRLQAEQRAARLRSAVVRMQALLAKHKAEQAEKHAEASQ
jgi:hypothetical protein